MGMRPTVFVVDDDEGSRNSLCWLIESAGLYAEAYNSGHGFLAAYDPGRPGCLILDLYMPGMTGLDLLAELGERLTIPVILITGDSDSASECTRERSVILCVAKPPQSHVLLDSVQRAIRLDTERRTGGKFPG